MTPAIKGCFRPPFQYFFTTNSRRIVWCAAIHKNKKADRGRYRLLLLPRCDGHLADHRGRLALECTEYSELHLVVNA